MTTKLKKSNIEVNGEIWITNYETHEQKKIELSALNKSKSGVYCLRNKLNGRLYIGMASNLERRKWRHFNDLLKGTHPSKLMQFDFDEAELTPEQIERMGKHPRDLFEFEVIIYCYPSQLTFWEGILIDNLHPYYNTKKKKEIKIDSSIVDELDKQLFAESDLIEDDSYLDGIL